MIWTVTRVFSLNWLDEDLIRDYIEFHNAQGKKWICYQRDYPHAKVGDRYIEETDKLLIPLPITVLEIDL